jgi:DNA-binding response OmpR family regulator
MPALAHQKRAKAPESGSCRPARSIRTVRGTGYMYVPNPR